MTKACKDCIFFVAYYGNKSRDGTPTVSKYRCVARNGYLKKQPKECDKKKVKE